LILTTSLSTVSTDPDSDRGLPEVDTLGLVLGLERLELSTLDGSTILYRLDSAS